MNRFFRPTWAEISLDAFDHNLRQFRRILPSHMKIMAVVKADAYGHGAVEISKEAIRCGVDYLAVAFLDEALELRQAGITAPILILGYVPPDGIPIAIERDITITVYDREGLHRIEQYTAQHGKTAKIHIKIDTGMGRLGFHHDDDLISIIDHALHLPGVMVEGLYTHYACADEADKTYTHEQHQRFDRIVKHFKRQNKTFPYLHAGNSATAIDTPELSYNMVRLGIALYGLYPSEQINVHRIHLEPVMTFKTGIVSVKTLPPDSGVSYGAVYRTKDYEQIATLPIGYADGYSRILSEQTEVLFRGKKVPVVGRICMDQCMIQVTGFQDVRIGEEIVLFGRQGDEVISAVHLAQKLGTIHYEIVCKVSHRVPRVYVQHGKTVRIINRLVHE